MKKYIVFYVSWLVFSIIGWLLYILTHLDWSVSLQMDMWFGGSCLYDILISASLAMVLTICV